MQSISSVTKITRAMQLIASARLTSVRRQMETANAFAAPAIAAWDEANVKPDAVKAANPVTAYVLYTSDTGMCGAINPRIIRHIKPILRQTTDDDTAKVISIGSSGRGGLAREFGHFMAATYTGSDKLKVQSFKNISMITADVISNVKYDKGQFLYNKFINALVTDLDVLPFYSEEVMYKSFRNKYIGFNLRPLFRNFYEFRMAVYMFKLFNEALCSETATRMSSMSGATKNANEMYNELQRLYNRTRQAKVTAELSEVVAGAAAVEEE